MDIIDALTQFGLTKQESIIYTTLLAEGSLTGYEVAKLTGISRSNTYTSLAGLVEKGAAYMIESTATHYTAVAIGEFCDNKIRRQQQLKMQLLSNIPDKREDVEGYITIKGDKHILDKMRNMLVDAKERVYLSVSDQILNEILLEVRGVLERGLKVVLITNKVVALKDAVVYVSDKPLYQIRMIVDSRNVLTGDINDGDNSTCLYSKKRNLVDLFKDALRNEIALIEAKKEIRN